MEELDQLGPFNRPVPGQSLTEDPANPMAHSKPPRFVDMDEALMFSAKKLSEPEMLDSIHNLMRADMPVEQIAQMLLFDMFRTGQVTPDLALLMIEPMIYLLIYIADVADIEITIYPKAAMEQTYARESEMLRNLQNGADVDEVEAPEEITEDLLSVLKNKTGEEK